MQEIDIIMPAYNCAKYIKSAIESVKKQTYQNWRLIIIDDGSTDNTAQVIQSATNDIKEKVELIKCKKNLGVAEARNLGIRKSTNRYIAFLDADDVWLESKLEKQLKFMKDNAYEFTYTLYTYCKNNRKKEVKHFIKTLNYKQALKNTFILTSTVMIDTRVVPKELLHMPNVKSEDTATWWRILKQGYIAYGLEENLTLYRVTKQSLSSNKFVNLKRTWNLYRKQEKLSIIQASYYFVNYVYHAIIKRIIR